MPYSFEDEAQPTQGYSFEDEAITPPRTLSPLRAPQETIPARSIETQLLGGAIAPFEAAASLAGEAINFPISAGIAAGGGYRTLAETGSMEEAGKAIQEMQSAIYPYIVYQPKTEEGKWLTEGLKKIIGYIPSQIGKGVGEIAQKVVTPVAGTDIGAYVGALGETTGELAAMGGLAKIGGAVIKQPSILKELPSEIKKSITPTPRIETVVEKGMMKGIKPPLSSVGITASQKKAYLNKAQESITEIIKNKDVLKLKNIEGEVRTGLPENVSDFAQAIEQQKRSIFVEYDTLAKKAGQKGAIVDLNPISVELNKIATNKVLKDLSPEITKYAETRMYALGERKTYTTIEAQDAIARLNNSLEAYYKNPSYETAGKARVDALIANDLRRALDNTIETEMGTGYQGLKNRYGALSAIEKDVNRRALTEANKNIMGFVDFSNIFAGSEAVKGLLTASPSAMASAATIKGIASWHKWRNSPNAIIKSMFMRAERSLSEKISPIQPSEPPFIPKTILRKRQELPEDPRKYRSATSAEAEATADFLKRVRELRQTPQHKGQFMQPEGVSPYTKPVGTALGEAEYYPSLPPVPLNRRVTFANGQVWENINGNIRQVK